MMDAKSTNAGDTFPWIYRMLLPRRRRRQDHRAGHDTRARQRRMMPRTRGESS